MCFYCLQEIPDPLLAPVHTLGHPYGKKSNKSAHLITTFSGHNLCPLCCILLPIPFCDETSTSVDKGRAVNVIHIDFSKDFDIVSHYIIGSKVKTL